MGVMEILFDNGPERVLGITEQEIRRRVFEAYPDAKLKVRDLTGGGDHYQVEVTSQAFSGVSPVMRHRMVYKLFSDVIGKELHALALTCVTP